MLANTRKSLWLALLQNKTSLQRTTASSTSIGAAIRAFRVTPPQPSLHPVSPPTQNNTIRICNSISIFHNNSSRYDSRRIGPIQIRSMSGTFGSGLEESVKKTISDNPLVIYSKTFCSYSAEVKSLFRKLGADAHVIELDQLGAQGPELQEVLEKLTGQHTVPNVFIGGKHIGGCTDTVKLHREGELEKLLSEADAL